ncbi:ribbon-helix-helix domain-containing protein [Methanonatronarchaeum sp. AMET-Sl]|uniref:ribbon-helix-helix domain-containing protein n=1 Tax=Methanonatronarchaeum sp. AMET-Sl TaxID=3037654 RepID=UPI00244E56CD|nr:ribbon-helix-helix domain-containing protein [Methanonatronarchaeum sp. AMET-Sl]WGI17782.1 ribbon-helix-helix domain-containing protein [Methanonatronarchaeum sp. AMET-Sl]
MKPKMGHKRITIRMNNYLIEQIDKQIEQNKFTNRSEVIRTATQEFITRQQIKNEKPKQNK